MAGEPRTERPIEWVRWVDSVTTQGWQPLSVVLPDAEYDHMECVSVGHLVNETDTGLTLTTTIGHAGGENVMDALSIPKAAVLERRTLTEVVPDGR